MKIGEKKYKEKRFSLLATEQNNHGFGKLSQSEFTFQSDYLNITMGRKNAKQNIECFHTFLVVLIKTSFYDYSSPTYTEQTQMTEDYKRRYTVCQQY